MNLVCKREETVEDCGASDLADKVLKLFWLAEDLVKQDGLPVTVRPKIEMILWLAEELVKEDALPSPVKQRVKTIACGVSRHLGESFALVDGGCARCGGRVFDTSMRIDSEGHCLASPLDSGIFYCERCGHRVRL